MYVFFFKQKTAYEMRISDWSSDVCSSDLRWLQLCRDIHDVDRIGRPEQRHQRRGELRGGLDDLGPFASLRVKLAHTDYTHTEFESDEEIGRASCRERVCQYV